MINPRNSSTTGKAVCSNWVGIRRAADQRRGYTCTYIKVHKKDGTTWTLDVGVVLEAWSGAVWPARGLTPRRAAEACAATKSARYADQHNFVPFTVETGGRVNCAGMQILDVLSGVAGVTDVAPVRVDGRLPWFGAVEWRSP